uniref:HAT C-terminal dimerisation domain-containing protein n=1 Tax=Latimeria chalumnae TaxID=7897 RepID=H3ANJ3_LATCH
RGIRFWKYALEKYKKHKCSEAHRECIEKIRYIEKEENVAQRLNDQHEEARQQVSHCLLRILQALQYLARKGIATYGHDDLNSNFKQLLLLMSKNDDVLRDWLTWKTTWTSVPIQEEIIALIASTIQHDIAREIRERKMFGLMADETADVSRIEQMVITVRSVEDDLEVYEELLGLHLLDCCNSKTIYKTLKDILIRLIIPLGNCRAFCAEGAATFQGAVTGVITRFQDDKPQIVQTHCHMHSVNLAMSDAISNERPLCPTHFSVKYQALLGLKEQVGILLEIFAEIEETVSENRMKAQVGGYAKALENFESYFSSVIESEKMDTTPPILPRTVRVPKKLQQSEPHCFESPQAFYRAKYFSIIDSANGTLQQCILDKPTPVLLAMEDVLMAGWKGEALEDEKTDLICNFFGRDIDRDHLCHQLKCLENTDDQNTMKQSISEIVSILRDHPVLRKMLPVVVKLIHLYLTSPATTAIAERSFSMLRQIKTYLRGTMLQPRSNSLITLNIHKEKKDHRGKGKRKGAEW